MFLVVGFLIYVVVVVGILSIVVNCMHLLRKDLFLSYLILSYPLPNVPLPQTGKGDTWSYLRVCIPGLPKELMGMLEDDNQSPGLFRSEIQ